jgi:plastocyanin
MSVRRGVYLLVACALALAIPSAAQAATRTMTLRYGPVSMGGFNVKFPKVSVRSPGVDGYVVRMHADLVDAHGRAVTIRDVMLHHTVFFQQQPTVGLNDCGGRKREAFYGTGEEDESLRLPAGYGYRTHANSRWSMNAMLMSHSTRLLNVYIRYRVTVVTGRRMHEVRPFWVRASACHITYPVWGDGKPGDTVKNSFTWKIPMDGHIVAAGGHLHGGSEDMWLTQPRCADRKLLDTSPRYGMPNSLYYRARPVLHEPGPIETRYFLSGKGIPVHKGEKIDLHAIYDNSQPHSRVMAIMHVYLAPGKVSSSRKCAALPSDARELTRVKRVRTSPPAVTIPLNEVDAKGKTHPILNVPWPVKPVASGSVVHLRNFAFSPQHVEIKTGGSLVWSFDDKAEHNLTFANGPRLIRGPTMANGRRYKTTFDTPGRYELFCYLHPMTMHEVVDVKQ